MSHPRRLAVRTLARNYGKEVHNSNGSKLDFQGLGGVKDGFQHALPGSSPAPNSAVGQSPGPNRGSIVDSPGPNPPPIHVDDGIWCKPMGGFQSVTNSVSQSPQPKSCSSSSNSSPDSSIGSQPKVHPAHTGSIPSPQRTIGLRIAVPSPAPVSSPPNYDTLPAIQRSNRWVITGTLQQSLFGVVKLAFDRKLKTQVAIKISRRELSNKQHTRSGSTVLENVKREAAVMRYLKSRESHGPIRSNQERGESGEKDSVMCDETDKDEEELIPITSSVSNLDLAGQKYVAQFVDEMEDEYFHYMITEFVCAGDMYSMLTSYPNHRFPEDQARHFFKQVVLGCKYLHDRNIAHLDLSLENVCLDLDDSIRIIDFGLALIHPLTPLESSSQHLLQYSSCNTISLCRSDDRSSGCTFLCKPANNKPGKLRYMSPELLSNCVWDAYKNDIFALGVILYSLLTGRPPFQQATGDDVWFNVIYSGTWLTPAVMTQPAAHVYTHLSLEARDLINIIIKSQEKRPTCEQILQHPWFQKVES